jgi:integration host factor subunit alpha
MRKKDIVDSIYRLHGGRTFHELGGDVDCALECIRRSLRRGETVLLSGFGRFDVYRRKGRTCFVPGTDRIVAVATRRAVRFAPSRLLLTRLNPGRSGAR